MKNRIILFVAHLSLLLSSCATTTYFQVYKAAPSDPLALKDNNLVYEDENCKVSYHLWQENGNSGFQFFNKTDQNIYLNLEECFFIVNGFSYNYYRNRVYTNSTSRGSAVSKGAELSKSVAGINFADLLQTHQVSASSTIGSLFASGSSVSYTEDKIVCIPSLTSKAISEYTINESLYRDCELFKHPRRRQVNTLAFSKTNTPLVFGNRIAYTLCKTDPLVRIEHEFYVNEITNYTYDEMTDSRFEEFCGQKSKEQTIYFKNVSADKFYVKYTKDDWEH